MNLSFLAGLSNPTEYVHISVVFNQCSQPLLNGIFQQFLLALVILLNLKVSRQLICHKFIKIGSLSEILCLAVVDVLIGTSGVEVLFLGEGGGGVGEPVDFVESLLLEHAAVGRHLVGFSVDLFEPLLGEEDDGDTVSEGK
jgi:hypothetical protein